MWHDTRRGNGTRRTQWGTERGGAAVENDTATHTLHATCGGHMEALAVGTRWRMEHLKLFKIGI